jgi:hypothetical protein
MTNKKHKILDSRRTKLEHKFHMGDVNEDNRKKHFGLTKRRYRLLSLI